MGKEESKIQNKKGNRINKILSVSNWGENMAHTNIFAFLGHLKETWLKFLAGV